MRTSQRLLWAAVIIVPLAILFLLLHYPIHDPAWVGPTFHFYIVSLTSLVAFSLAVLITVAAAQLRDVRVFFLALAFMGIAGIFFAHALTTPGALVPGPNVWVGFSAHLSMFVGALFFTLSTIDLSSRLKWAIMRRQGRIVGAFAVFLTTYAVYTTWQSLATAEPAASASHDHGYGAMAVIQSDSVAGLPALLSSPVVSWGIGMTTLGLLGLVAARYALLYHRSRRPLVAGFLISAIFTAQGHLSMMVAPPWHASWWEYHALLLGAFCAACIGLVREYARTGNLQDVVEGLLLRDTIAQLQRGYTDVIVALVGAVEAKDPYTRGHTQRVADLALLIGQQLHLPPERLRTLNQAAMLHDIGKIGIPDSILNKPGPLTADEFEIVKQHPVRGYQIIRHVRSLQQEIGGVRHHHERLDGSGYPDGLAGEAIPLEARIIAVADVFDALTSERSYRPAWPIPRALDLLDAEAGRTLDPRCVDALRRALPSWCAGQTREGQEMALLA